MMRVAVAKARQVHVGIVGAGFAGLRCADVLMKHGCKVTILEARNRVGGRVAQSSHLGHLVDLGPNWIHGTIDNPILDIAKETGTILHEWDENQSIFKSDGSAMAPDEVMEYNELAWQGLLANAFKYSKKQGHEIDPQRSLYQYFQKKVQALFQDLPDDVATQKRETLIQTLEFWGAYVGSPVQRQSLKYFWLEEFAEGENPFVAETYHKILDVVAKPALKSANIKCNSIVKRITYGRSDGEAGHSIETSDGARYDFDEVVVTTPLGWLKRNGDVFHPPLPPRLSQAIDDVGYGALDKVYITFPSAFWETSSTSILEDPSSSHSNGSNKSVEASLNVGAKSTSSQQQTSDDTSSHYHGFISWLAPSYAPETNTQGWIQQGCNLAALSGGCAHPTMLFYIFGDCSKHIGELVKSSKSDSERDARLLDFFRPYYSRLPNFNAEDADCKPKAVLATAWAVDEFAGYGSYTNFQIGAERGDEDIGVMRQGVPDQGLWFAGEHTAPLDFLGTSSGAYRSGEKVARRIGEAYGLQESAA